jgi:hypothetical protein
MPIVPNDPNDPTNDPNGLKYMDPLAIKNRITMGQYLTKRATEPFAPHWTGVAAAGLTGLHGGLERAGAESALSNNQQLTSDALKRAGEAPDNISMSQALIKSGIPGMGERGLDILSSHREKLADQNSPMGQAKLKLLQAQANAAQANADPNREYKIRALQAAQQGLQYGTPEFQRFVLTGSLSNEKARQFSVGDITKLTEEGNKFGSITGFSEKFKDEYAGYKTQGAGDAATYLGRNVPWMPGAASKEATAFWQEYDRYKNVVRNELFGSALTAPETANFERADINPGMDPQTIRANLAIQKESVTSALKKKASALIQAGFDPAPIAAAYGLDLKDLGITTQRMKGATSVPGTTAATPEAQTSGAPAVGEVRKGYRFKGGDPSDQNSWEKAQ